MPSTRIRATRSRFPELLAEEKLEPWTVREVWIAGSPTPTNYVDITDTFPRKVAALRCHVSQINDPDGLEEFLRGWLSSAAAQGGLPRGPAGRGVPGAADRLARPSLPGDSGHAGSHR